MTRWKEGIIVPIVKKGEETRVEKYKRVTLIATLYKIYMGVLAERLREKVEGKKILSGNQTGGFRKGLNTMDNIYVVNYLVNRQLAKKARSIAAFL